MAKFILGLKLGMTQFADEKGSVIPVTLVEAGPCEVTQLKTKEKDGYEAIQMGFVKKEKKVKKSEKGKEFRYLKEFRPAGLKVADYGVGKKIDVSLFKEGDFVKVSGLTKGKGYAGTIKRWGFAGKDSTHGTKHESRAPGSIGGRTPSRVTLGKKMAGKTGNERITVKNLKVAKIDLANNVLAVRGAVPGRKGTLLEIIG